MGFPDHLHSCLNGRIGDTLGLVWSARSRCLLTRSLGVLESELGYSFLFCGLLLVLWLLCPPLALDTATALATRSAVGVPQGVQESGAKNGGGSSSFGATVWSFPHPPSCKMSHFQKSTDWNSRESLSWKCWKNLRRTRRLRCVRENGQLFSNLQRQEQVQHGPYSFSLLPLPHPYLNKNCGSPCGSHGSSLHTHSCAMMVRAFSGLLSLSVGALLVSRLLSCCPWPAELGVNKPLPWANHPPHWSQILWLPATGEPCCF